MAENGMITEKIWFDFMSADCQYQARKVIERMGWTIDENPDGDGAYSVHLPQEDLDLFDFLDISWS